MIPKVADDDFGANVPRKKVVLPDKTDVTIREMNGEDEDILTRVKDARDGSAMQNFLANLILSPVTTPEQVLSWGVRKKYYLLLEARVFTHGPDLFFTYRFEDGTEVNMKENLSQFLVDFLKPVPKKGEAGYKETTCQPYENNNPKFRVTLSSKKTFELEYLTGKHEVASLDKDINNLSVNERLRVRDIHLVKDTVLQKIERFNMLSAREMNELRSKVEEADPEFNLNIPLVNPKTKATEYVSLISLSDFFFPRA